MKVSKKNVYILFGILILLGFSVSFFVGLLVALIVFFVLKKIDRLGKDHIDDNIPDQELDDSSIEDIEEEKIIYFKKEHFLTYQELIFYKKLLSLSGRYTIIPQVNLASIIDKKDSRYRTELFRNIDFGIFSKDLDLLLLIELNDVTHSYPDRQYRDKKIKEILSQCKIPLLTFYTSYPNEEHYIIQRIENTIREYSSPSLLKDEMIEQEKNNTNDES